MSYASYVIAAYAVFAVVLLWDYVAPRMRIAQVVRAARLLGRRLDARHRAADQELKR